MPRLLPANFDFTLGIMEALVLLFSVERRPLGLRVTVGSAAFGCGFAGAGSAVRLAGRPGKSTKSGEPSDGIAARVGFWFRMFQTTAATVNAPPKTIPNRIQIGAMPVEAGG